MTVLEVHDLHKRFAGVAALDGISVTIDTQVPTAIIGPNGSGKTTLFNTISGFIKPDGGLVFWGGRNITRWSAHRIARSGVVRTFQQRVAFLGLTVWENVRVAALSAGLRGRDCDRAIQDALEMMMVSEFAGELSERLPYGINRRVGIACTLPLSPELVLLDEPAAGLSTAETIDLATSLRAIRANGLGICLVEHNMDFVSEFSEQVIVINAGAKLKEGTPQAVTTDPQVAEVYLGHAAQG